MPILFQVCINVKACKIKLYHEISSLFKGLSKHCGICIIKIYAISLITEALANRLDESSLPTLLS